MSDTRYIYDYVGTKTRWKKRLIIYPANAVALDQQNLNDIPLPPGSVTVKSLERSYDKFNWGMISGGMMEIEFNFEKIGNDAKYDEFYDTLFNPVVEYDQFFANHKYNGGTVFKWQIDFAPQDTTGVGYRDVFWGIQREGIEDSLATETKIEVEDAIRCTLDSFSLETLFAQYQNLATNGKVRDNSIALMYQRNGYNYLFRSFSTLAVGHGYNNPDSLWFFPLSEIFDYIEAVASATLSTLMREDYPVFDVTPPSAMKYYKQTHNDDGALGASLGFADLWVIAAVADQDTLNGSVRFDGVFEQNTRHSLYNGSRYTNAWDFLVDLYKESIMKTMLLPGGVQQVQCGGIYTDGFYSAGAIINLSKDLLLRRYHRTKDRSDYPSIRLNKDGINHVTSSLYESEGEDINKFDAESTGSRNESSETIPVVFNNMPAAPSGSKNNSDGWENTRVYVYIAGTPFGEFYQLFPRLNNLYYFALPSLAPSATIEEAFRVHEFCKINLGNGLFSTNLPGGAFVPFDTSQYNLALDSIDFALPMQLESCKPKITAEAAVQLFKEPNWLEFKIDYHEITSFTPGGSGIGFIWWEGFGNRFTFDPTEFRPRMTNVPTNWYMVGTKLDDEKETAEIKMISEVKL